MTMTLRRSTSLSILVLSACTFGAQGSGQDSGAALDDGVADGDDTGDSGDGSAGDDGSDAPDGDSSGAAIEGPRLRLLTLRDAAELAGAPLLIRLDPSTIEYADTLPGGDDVEVRVPGGDALPLEVETWDPEGTSILWVRLPGTDVSELELVYATGVAATRDAAAVWDQDFAAVWHLAGNADDSTSHARHGTTGTVTAGEGWLGSGMRFDGEAIAVETPPDWGDALTIEGWVHRDANDPSEARFIALQNNAVALRVEEPGLAQPRLRVWLEGGTKELGPPTTLDPDWTWVAASYDAGELEFFVDGESVAKQDVGGGAITASGDPLRLGQKLIGVLDEVRLSTVARGGAWIEAQYRSMTDAVVTIGEPEPL